MLIVGAGAAGLCAALAASEAGVEPVVIERDAVPSRLDRAVGRAHPGGGHALPARAGHRGFGEALRRGHRRARRTARPTRSWCARSRAGRTDGRMARATPTRMPFEVITDFNYPGHSAHRMHGLPSRTGAELIDRLRSAAEAREIPILTGPRLRNAVRRRGRLHRRRRDRAAARARPSAAARWCSPATAMAAIRALVRRHIPEMARCALLRPSGQPGRRGAVGRSARRAAWRTLAATRGTARSRRRTTS